MKKLAIMLLCCLVLAGCGRKADAANGSEEETSIALDASVLETIPAETTVPETILLTVYSPDGNAEGFVEAQVEVDAVTEPAIVEQLVLAGVLAEGTKVNLLELTASSDAPDWDQLHVDFNGAFRDRLLSMGTAGEYTILGSVVNTFLTAYDAQSMTITVDGQVLESGHAVYDGPLEFFA